MPVAPTTTFFYRVHSQLLFGNDEISSRKKIKFRRPSVSVARMRAMHRTAPSDIGGSDRNRQRGLSRPDAAASNSQPQRRRLVSSSSSNASTSHFGLRPPPANIES